MATDKYPNQNVNMPMKEGALAGARQRLDPGRPSPSTDKSVKGKGSRREVRPGEWFDDRVIDIGGPSSPSTDSPPELGGKSERTVPATYDPLKVYSVTLGRPAMFCGRQLAPGKTYQMVGDACTEITASIIDAQEVGDIPVDPDSQPS